MKIQCDVCNKDEASVFCSADDAALCSACDHRVHHANKLAGKHQRFSLLTPSPKDAPLCDICQEKRGFLFCQEDRAILCRECDIPIHKVNEHTQKHNRFVLTGVKLSPTSAIYSSSTSSASDSNLKSQNSIEKPVSVPTPAPIANPPPVHKCLATTTAETTTGCDNDNENNNDLISGVGNGSTSSISEYLIETLPGWQVEEFLDYSSSNHFGFSKTGENDVFLPLWDGDLDENLNTFPSHNKGIWVPQAPPVVHNSQYLTSNMNFGGTISFKEGTNKIKSSRKWTDDGCFTVPQISPPSTASKRSRTLW